MRQLALVSLLAAAAHAADGPKLVEPVSENGVPVVYRSARFDVPPGTAVRLEVSLAEKGKECFDGSTINWDKKLIDGKRFHTINFDVIQSMVNGKPPAGCPKRESGFLGLHTVDLPAEKGPMHVWLTWREGTEVRATYGAKFSANGGSPGVSAAEPTRTP